IAEATPSTLCGRITMLEGVLDDLLSIGATKLRTSAINKTISNHKVDELISIAKDLDASLLKNTPKTTRWWLQLFTIFSVPEEQQPILLQHIVSLAKTKINRTRERPEHASQLQSRR